MNRKARCGGGYAGIGTIKKYCKNIEIFLNNKIFKIDFLDGEIKYTNNSRNELPQWVELFAKKIKEIIE